MIPETVDKVATLYKYCSERGIDLDIEVDGGISADNIGLVTQNGANIIVAGSAVFKSDDPANAVKALKGN
jgi:ribulose-phosphate 3-epimerase